MQWYFQDYFIKDEQLLFYSYIFIIILLIVTGLYLAYKVIKNVNK